jgi:hypothetical protein
VEDGNVAIGPRVAFRLLAQETRTAMLGHLAMHSDDLIRTIEILGEATNVYIANLTIRFDQLPRSLMMR